MKAHPHQREQLLSAFELAKQLPIESLTVNHTEVIGLALQTGLTTYDASYLWLAEETRAELITLDQQLLRTAKKVMSD